MQHGACSRGKLALFARRLVVVPASHSHTLTGDRTQQTAHNTVAPQTRKPSSMTNGRRARRRCTADGMEESVLRGRRGGVYIRRGSEKRFAQKQKASALTEEKDLLLEREPWGCFFLEHVNLR